MNEGKVSIKQKRKEAPVWVFAWKPLGRPWPARVLPVLLVGSLFALAFVALSIQVTPPKPWDARKGVVIHALANQDGNALGLLAREGGPFPSRFDLRKWTEDSGLEEAVLRMGVREPTPYVPRLRRLDSSAFASGRGLVEAGFPVLPTHSADQPVVSPIAENIQLVPVIRALSGLRLDDLPSDLPLFEQGSVVDWAARSWRFLVRIDRSGNVMEAVGLSGESDAALADWLMGVVFPSKGNKAPRWIGVEVDFINRKKNGPGNR